MKTTRKIAVVMMAAVMVFGLLAAVPFTASAATFSVSGTVIDRDGNTLKNAEVVLKIGGSADSSLENIVRTGDYYATTGSGGKFTFPAVASGVYSVYVYNVPLDYYYSIYVGKTTVSGNVTDLTLTVSQMGGTWVKNQNGTWSYKLTDGNLATGWRKDGGTWYYMNAAGIMQTGWVCFDDLPELGIPATWYYFTDSGAMVTGWVKWNGDWYYLDPSGEMAANTSRKIDGKTYKFNSSGVCTNP